MNNIRAGIYTITVTVPGGKVYVGASGDVEIRIEDHKRLLTKGEHTNRQLQAAYDEHGIGSLRFDKVVSLLEPNSDALCFYEQAVMDSIPSELKYNVKKATRSRLGIKTAPRERSRLPCGAADLDALRRDMLARYEAAKAEWNRFCKSLAPID